MDPSRPAITGKDQLPPIPRVLSDNPVQVAIPAGTWVLDTPDDPSKESPDILTEFTLLNPGWLLERVSSSIPAELPDKPNLEQVDLPITNNIEQANVGADEPPPKASKPTFIPTGFFKFNGRTVVWATGWGFIKQSIWLGYGFHGDRLVLGTHIHNSFMHAMIQTGLIGTLSFIAAMVYGWILMLKIVFALGRIPAVQKQLVIQTAGILVFLSIRAIFESTGAFFSVDWLLLAPLLLYLQIVDSNRHRTEEAL